METPHIMHSSLRQVSLGGGNQYTVADYRSGTDVTGSFASHTFPAFVGTGVYLVVVRVPLIDSGRSENTDREPLQINKINAVLMGSDGTDVIRDGQPYGAFPPEVKLECTDHTHTVSGAAPIVGISGADSFPSIVGQSRRWQIDQQVFFIIDARRGDRLFVFRDYAPYTALTYEIIRLAPALMRYGSIEI